MSLDFLLRSFAEEDKPQAKRKEEVSLTGILQRKRLQLSKKKGPREASLSFSPYNIGYGFCMREKVAQLAGYHKIMIKPPTPKEQLIFDVGKKYHDIIQRYFWKANMLEGEFSCTNCLYKWWARSPEACLKCSKKTLQYREVPLKNKEYMISGRSDGILWIEKDKEEVEHLVDIKSISNKGAQHNSMDPRLYFEDLEERGPAENHIVQLQVYMFLSGIHDGHLLYAAKNAHQLKSFYVQYNAPLLEPFLSDIKIALAWSKELKEGIRTDLPMPCASGKCLCEGIISGKGGE